MLRFTRKTGVSSFERAYSGVTKTSFPYRYTWIGLNDLKNESDYRWSDGANLTYKSMSPQMDYMKDERADQEMDCIASDQNGQWTNFHCDDKFYSLCKKKLSKYINTLIVNLFAQTVDQPISRLRPCIVGGTSNFRPVFLFVCYLFV